MGLILDVSRCVFSDCMCACVFYVCGDAPSGLRTGGRASHHPISSQPATSHGLLPTSLPGQLAQLSKTLCALSSKMGLWHRPRPWHCLRSGSPAWRCACGCGQHLPALLVLSKERIIIPGQAASATNLREVIVERVERQKIGASIQPSIRVIK